MMSSKRKSSDLTTEEVSNVVSLLKDLVADLDKEDEDGQIVIENVQSFARSSCPKILYVLGFFFPLY